MMFQYGWKFKYLDRFAVCNILKKWNFLSDFQNTVTGSTYRAVELEEPNFDWQQKAKNADKAVFENSQFLLPWSLAY